MSVGTPESFWGAGECPLPEKAVSRQNCTREGRTCALAVTCTPQVSILPERRWGNSGGTQCPVVAVMLVGCLVPTGGCGGARAAAHTSDGKHNAVPMPM